MKYDEDIIFLCTFFDAGKRQLSRGRASPTRVYLFPKENNSSRSSSSTGFFGALQLHHVVVFLASPKNKRTTRLSDLIHLHLHQLLSWPTLTSRGYGRRHLVAAQKT